AGAGWGGAGRPRPGRLVRGTGGGGPASRGRPRNPSIGAGGGGPPPRLPTAQPVPEGSREIRFSTADPATGAGMIVQRSPLKCSTSGWNRVPVSYPPTAQMSRGEAAATPNRLAPVPVSGGLGPRTRVQARPFQCCTSGRKVNRPTFSLPTAHTLVALSAVTAHRSLSSVPACGAGTTCHVLPFQCSISDR